MTQRTGVIASLATTDTEILDFIERHIMPESNGRPSSASVKLSAKLKDGYVKYRFGGGRWHDTMREAVRDHARRYWR